MEKYDTYGSAVSMLYLSDGNASCPEMQMASVINIRATRRSQKRVVPFLAAVLCRRDQPLLAQPA
jgi:hypothetical protein